MPSGHLLPLVAAFHAGGWPVRYARLCGKIRKLFTMIVPSPSAPLRALSFRVAFARLIACHSERIEESTRSDCSFAGGAGYEEVPQHSLQRGPGEVFLRKFAS